MKVICLKKHKVNELGEDLPSPEVGDIDTVTDKYQSKQSRDFFYHLERFGERYGYLADYFAILPDQSADEMQEQEREGIVNLEIV